MIIVNLYLNLFSWQNYFKKSALWKFRFSHSSILNIEHYADMNVDVIYSYLGIGSLTRLYSSTF